MGRNTSYAAEILQRDPDARSFNLGLFILVVILIASRIPVLASAVSPIHRPEIIAMVADGAAVASGRVLVPAEPSRPRLDAYVAALPFSVWRFGWHRHLSPTDFEAFVARSTTTACGLLGACALLVWLATALALFSLVRSRIDETAARFSMWLMIFSPAGLMATGEAWPSIFALPAVCGALYCATCLVQRSALSTYVMAGVFVAIAGGFSYHYLLLFIPILYAHFFTDRLPREHFIGLFFYPRMLAMVVCFLLVSVLVHPQLWGLVGVVSSTSDLASLQGAVGKYFATTPSLLLLDNAPYRQLSWVAQGASGYHAVNWLPPLLGFLPTLLALLAACIGFFRRDQRPWRPVVLYLLVAIVSRCMVRLPGVDWGLNLVPALILLLTVNVLPLVARVGHRRERMVYVIVGLLLCLQPAWGLGKRIASYGRINTADVARMELTMRSLGPDDVYHLGVFVHAEAGTQRIPIPTTGTNDPEKVFSSWGKRLPAVSSLRKKKFKHVLVSFPFLRRLRQMTTGPAGERVGRVISQFEALKRETYFPPTSSGTVIGEQLELLHLGR